MAVMRITFLLIGITVAMPTAGRVQQTATPAITNTSPAVSPDGRWIAFLSNRDGNPELYVVATDGTGERRLTTTAVAEGRPDWTSNGRQLRYLIGSGESSELHELDPATGTSKRVGQINGRSAHVAPDGRRVAYMSGTFTASALAVSALDGTGATTLTTAEQTSVAWNARFSPDGKWIAFTGQDANRQLHIFVVAADGTGLKQLTRFTQDEGRAQGPSWSADGKRLAFQVNRKGSSRIWMCDIDGSNLRPVTPQADNVLDESPAWFPDGNRFAFQSTRSGRMEIWTVNLDGTALRQVTGLSK
jgi:TolB protein